MERSESKNTKHSRYINSIRITDDLINEWMKQLKVKKTEYAQFLTNKIEEGAKRKTSKASMNGYKQSIGRG